MRDALAVSFEIGSREKVPGIFGACATRKFMYLVRDPWPEHHVGVTSTLYGEFIGLLVDSPLNGEYFGAFVVYFLFTTQTAE